MNRSLSYNSRCFDIHSSQHLRILYLVKCTVYAKGSSSVGFSVLKLLKYTSEEFKFLTFACFLIFEELLCAGALVTANSILARSTSCANMPSKLAFINV